MLGQFIAWFVVFGLSFLFENFGWMEQGKAFLYISLSGLIVISVTILISLCFAGFGLLKYLGIPCAIVFLFFLKAIIALFATWGATQLFDVNFFVAYQIMTFGQCLCTNNKSF